VDEFLDRCIADYQRLIRRAEDLPPFTPEQFDWKPDPNSWSMGRIFEHMELANAPYLREIEACVSRAANSDNVEVRFSLLGRMIIWGSGPKGNVPAPKQLHPRHSHHDQERSVASFTSDYKAIISLAARARGTDISAVAFNNPFVGVLKMNLADAFEIAAVHGERHIGQIERIPSLAAFPGAS
jgi:hypothetical protein